MIPLIGLLSVVGIVIGVYALAKGGAPRVGIKSRKVATIVLCISFLFFIIAIASDSSPETAAVDEAPVTEDVTEIPEEPEEPAEEEPEPMITEKTAEDIVSEIAGLETNISEYKVRILDIAMEEDYIILQMVGDDNFSVNWVRTGLHSKAAKLFPALFEEFAEINDISIMWYLPLVDAKGNSSLSNVMNISMLRDTHDSINWPNFLYSNLPIVSDTYWQHAALN